MDDVTALIQYAERPRTGGWSLRSALVRYAQPEPARAGAVLELVRRTDGALKPFVKVLEASPHLVATGATSTDERDGAGDEPDDVADRAQIGGLVAAARALDRLGDVLAAWATERSDVRPDREVDQIAREVFTVLADLGVARETRPPRRS